MFPPLANTTGKNADLSDSAEEERAERAAGEGPLVAVVWPRVGWPGVVRALPVGEWPERPELAELAPSSWRLGPA